MNNFFEVDPFDWVTFKQQEYEKNWLETGGDKDAVEFFHIGQSLDDEEDKELYNLRKALKFYKLSAKLGYAPAMDEYANWISSDEEGVEKDVEKAITLLCKAIELGYIPSYSSLARIYEEVQGVECDIQKIIELYTVCAEANEPSSQFSLARILDCHLGKSKEAEHWYLKAMAGSLGSAANALGDMYYMGRGQGTYMPDSEPFKVDYFRAFSCYVQAYKLGCETALKDIADCYFNGRGAEMDKDAAIKMYIKASDNDSWAAETLGDIYMQGNGISQNVKKAISYWEKGAEEGNELCMMDLGDFYKFGETHDEKETILEEYIDYEQALYWYQCGAEHGDEYCQDQVKNHENGEW